MKRSQCVAGVGKCATLKVRKCANPCLFTINLTAQSCEMRGCVRSACGGAGAARGPSDSARAQLVSENFTCVVTLGEARHDCEKCS